MHIQVVYNCRPRDCSATLCYLMHTDRFYGVIKIYSITSTDGNEDVQAESAEIFRGNTNNISLNSYHISFH